MNRILKIEEKQPVATTLPDGNIEELPEPEDVLEALEELKSVKVEHVDTVKGEVCPDCGSPIIALSSGVKCSSCVWWFCY